MTCVAHRHEIFHWYLDRDRKYWNIYGDKDQIDPYSDFVWGYGKPEIRNLWFYKRWNLLGSIPVK